MAQHFTSSQEVVMWMRAHVTGALTSDSRLVKPGDGFIAWPGVANDPRKFVNTALKQGAAVCLVEASGVEDFECTDASVGVYPGLQSASGTIAAEFFGHPSKEISVVAITGTNGKTSTAWWLSQALSSLAEPNALPCAMVGTLGIGQPPSVRANDADNDGLESIVTTGLTTPDPIRLQSALREFVSQGHKVCALEASSIGIEEARLNGTAIRVAVFTNLTQDHLDYHATMHAYGQAKKRLFAWKGLRSAVINTDDLFGADLAQSLAATSPDIDIWTVALTANARLVARHIVATPQGLQFEVIEDGQSMTVKSHIMGEYNVANMLSVIASMRCLGVDLPEAIAACSQLRAVPGRMECLAGDDAPLVVVDYAHTPDALQQALQALRPAAQQRGGDLWCVFGCGGDRDTTKRPFMGAVATAQADKIIVTSDNPRSELPLSIIENILAGVSRSDRLMVQVDRALAIASAVAQANNADVILLAGKGHEATQEIAGVKSYFSDRVHASTALRQRAQDRRSVHA